MTIPHKQGHGSVIMTLLIFDDKMSGDSYGTTKSQKIEKLGFTVAI